jgi:hypothetical protein
MIVMRTSTVPTLSSPFSLVTSRCPDANVVLVSAASTSLNLILKASSKSTWYDTFTLNDSVVVYMSGNDSTTRLLLIGADVGAALGCK